MPESKVFNIDCMEYMANISDKYFDLAVVDPPYGIIGGFDKRKAPEHHTSGNSLGRFRHTVKWDNEIPTEEYFNELMRVSKNQIIFGGNYFPLPVTRCMIVWDKMTYIPTMSQIEIAWTSFKGHSKLKQINSNQKDRQHPSQKPIELYKWLFKEFAKDGDLILDTHLGSGSSRIAADKAGLDFTGIEIDKEYFDLSEKRFKQYKSQLRIEGW